MIGLQIIFSLEIDITKFFLKNSCLVNDYHKLKYGAWTEEIH